MNAEIGVIGGSGFYHFLDDVESVRLDTPYGSPSDKIAVGRVGDRGVAFIARHGSRHALPPAAINYRANLWALHSLGVTRVIAPSAAGSLQPSMRPGDIVVCDQFVDRTRGRADTYFDAGPKVAHVSTAHPYCPVLRDLTVNAAKRGGLPVHDQGTVVVIQGPRFSTQAESRWFSSMGWHLVNMTQYPEVTLARELEICYVNVSLVTDYDAGLEGDPNVKPVSVNDVVALFGTNIAKVRE
ncbi:MAG TPA: S-methyl-5'-thioadenosine phosphorylase, partial [Candidatus Dormibacteraeota bacterium]|nr:S-methyl-5'-thioadenosine phosphorylase [Candidatus Dormibacteraeota bacterium]